LKDQAVQWSVNDPVVASVFALDRGNAGKVFVLGRGTATVTASLQGQTASVTFTVSADPEPLLVGRVALDSARVIEVQGQAGGWFYAPIAFVRDLTGNGASIVGIQFFVPGVALTARCTGYRAIAPGGTLELFPEIYGDFALTFDRSGVRATSREGIAILYVGTLSGLILGRMEVPVPIVQGGWPKTYSGGRVENPWSC
jgi:hypothetical protein